MLCDVCSEGCKNRALTQTTSFDSLPPYQPGRLQKSTKKIKKDLHLWKFLVISLVRTNSAEMPGNRCKPGSREQQQSRETRW